MTTLKGIGSIRSLGGDSSRQAAGGGGRIALYYSDALEFDLANVTAYGGTHTYTATADDKYNGSAGTVYIKSPNLEPEIPQPFWICLCKESDKYCVRTEIWRMPELTQLLSVKSMIRYLPPKGTDALDRPLVKGCSLSPAPLPLLLSLHYPLL